MFQAMVRSIDATASGYENVQVVAYVDQDDPELHLYQSMFNGLGTDVLHVGPRILLTECWNRCLESAKGDILMQGNDDILFRTKGWNVEIERFFAESRDKIWCVHGNDLNPHRKPQDFGTHCFVHKRWVDTVGYFIAPYFSSDYGDTWLNEVANALGRRAYLPLVVEHMHYSFNKSALDKTAQERLDRHKRDNVELTWEETKPRRDEDVRKLREVIESWAIR